MIHCIFCTMEQKERPKKMNTRRIEGNHLSAARNLLPIRSCKHLLLHYFIPLILFCTTLTMIISLQDVWSQPISIPITTMIKHLQNGSPALFILNLLPSHRPLHLHHQSWILLYHQTYIPCPMNHPAEMI